MYASSSFLSLSATGEAISANAWPPNTRQNAFEDNSHFSTSQSVISSDPALSVLGYKTSAVKDNLHVLYLYYLVPYLKQKEYTQRLKTFPLIKSAIVDRRGFLLVVMLLVVSTG